MPQTRNDSELRSAKGTREHAVDGVAAVVTVGIVALMVLLDLMLPKSADLNYSARIASEFAHLRDPGLRTN